MIEGELNLLNEVLNVIKQRRSIRKFKDMQISDADLNLILEAASYAPSGSNSQTWIFTAIQNQEILRTLNEMVRQAFLNLELGEKDYPAKIAAKKRAVHENYNFYYHAPTLIVVSNIPNYPNAMADCATALENVFLAAHSLHLGSCWINQLTWLQNNQKIRDFLELLKLPKDHVICGSAAIGYIDGEMPTAPARKKDVIHIIR